MDYTPLEEPGGQALSAGLLTAVSLVGLPEDGSHFQFRCHLASHEPDGSLLLEQFTQPRTQPDWLVKFLHQGLGPVSVSIQMRHAPDHVWREIGEVRTYPAELLKQDRGSLVELAVEACRFAPNLHIRLQFSKADPGAPARMTLPGTLARPQKTPIQPAAEQTNQKTHAHDTAEVQAVAAIAETPALTPAEQVIVKDSWNKLLPFYDMLMEMFFERLLHEHPDLVTTFGDAIDNVMNDFCGLMDLAVRGLQPRTENILRESYRNVPGLPKLECTSVEAFVTLFTDLGMRPRHWFTARKIWIWVLHETPYLEDYDRENLRHGHHSAAYKFFNRHIIAVALAAHQAYEQALTPAMVQEMARCGAALAADSQAVGIEFYRLLFTRSPEIIEYFGRTDMDHLADHLFKAIAFLTETVQAGKDVLGALRHLAAVHTEFMVPPEAYAAIGGPILDVMRKHYPPFDGALATAWGVLLQRVVHILAQPMINLRRLLDSARQWLDVIASEQEWPHEDKERRWGEISREVRATGTYTHTYEELAYGAQVAWRNAPKCIARISWRNMIVRDLRHVTDPDEMFRETLEHIRMGINGGNMQIVMNVFRPKRPKERWGPRFWNPQYLRYAGYRQPDGTILGDGANVRLTQAIERLGWKPPQTRGAFDLLPLVIDVPGQAPRLYEISQDDAMQVTIEHPTVPKFAHLGLKWVAIPAISNFRMDIGGIQYGCIPFNGWFMETEIARNLWEAGRYDQSANIARVLGLDTSSEQTLWRDRAFLELNLAVLHSFSKAKVSLVDHQTASRQFLAHDLREKKAGRECPAQWSWVTPAAGGSTSPVWHHEMRDFYLSPHYHYAADKWAVLEEDITETEDDEDVPETFGQSVLILYGSETGTAEGIARQAARRLHAHAPRVMALDDCEPLSLAQEAFVLFVTSTFGEGDLPGNARRFGARLKQVSTGALSGLSYTVLALGSTVYPHFCAAGAMLDRELGRLGATRVIALHRADEIKGQASTCQAWLDLVARLLGEDPTVAVVAAPEMRVTYHPAPAQPASSGSATNVEPNTTATHTHPDFEVKVIANRELLKTVIPGSRSTRFIAFDLAGTGIQYQTGDHLSVFPRNPAAEVERLCIRLGLDPDTWFTSHLATTDGTPVDGETPYPNPVELRRILTEDFDLSLRDPLAGLVAAMARGAGAPEEKSQLTAWAESLSRSEHPNESTALSDSIISTHLNVADLLEAFPSCQLDLGRLLELLPKQKPRLYSISSSSLSYPTQVQLTIGVVQVKTAAGKVRQGLCSNYLASLDPARGDTARITVRTSTFRPPADLRTPMLMVGPGTGLSPLIGFLQHRGAQSLQLQNAGEYPDLGDARLYFGCRDLNDYIYQNDLEAWRANGLITHLAVAFSRASEKKTYVQHVIAEQGDQVWQVLSLPGSHYYICGDAKMADDVFDALMAIAQREGALTRGAAIDFFDRMKSEKRYHADVWGITLNFTSAIEEVREAKYSQGDRWLRQVNASETAGEKKADQLAGAGDVPVGSA